jgi:hypothetical protein
VVIADKKAGAQDTMVGAKATRLLGPDDQRSTDWGAKPVGKQTQSKIEFYWEGDRQMKRWVTYDPAKLRDYDIADHDGGDIRIIAGPQRLSGDGNCSESTPAAWVRAVARPLGHGRPVGWPTPGLLPKAIPGSALTSPGRFAPPAQALPGGPPKWLTGSSPRSAPTGFGPFSWELYR